MHSAVSRVCVCPGENAIIDSNYSLCHLRILLSQLHFLPLAPADYPLLSTSFQASSFRLRHHRYRIYPELEANTECKRREADNPGKVHFSV